MAALKEKLDTYRRVLRELDQIVDHLWVEGWFSEKERTRIENLIDQEADRVSRALAGTNGNGAVVAAGKAK